jgi:ComF family protein
LTEENHLCELCIRKRPFYDGLGSPFLYEGGIMEAVHQLKYGGKTHLAGSLGTLLASFAMGWLEKIDDYLMMPVPLHRKRLRERGFNQSLLLAKVVRRLSGWELDYLSLRRIRYTRPQTGLNSDERSKNVRQAFDLARPGEFNGKIVVLVDDVATTGNTMNECARVLKEARCDKVFCLTLARTAGY